MGPTLQFLSYELENQTPVFGANGPVRISVDADFSTGPYLQHAIETINHNGSHVDVPRHFSPLGKTLSDLPPETWFFSTVVLVDVPVWDDQVISGEYLESTLSGIAWEAADALVLRTGFGRYRTSDPDRYLTHNPGFGPDAADWLRARSTSVRALFCDIPSFTPYSDMPAGIAFHQRVLGQGWDDRFILLFEDIDLSRPISAIDSMWALPIRLKELDGAPVTIVAWTRD